MGCLPLSHPPLAGFAPGGGACCPRSHPDHPAARPLQSWAPGARPPTPCCAGRRELSAGPPRSLAPCCAGRQGARPLLRWAPGARPVRLYVTHAAVRDARCCTGHAHQRSRGWIGRCAPYSVASRRAWRPGVCTMVPPPFGCVYHVCIMVFNIENAQ